MYDDLVLNGDLPDIAAKGMAIGIGNFLNGAVDIFSNYEKAWQEEYFSHGWMTVDPVVRTGLRREGVFDWPDMDEPGTEFATAASDHGLRNGIIISQNIGGSRCIAGISIDKPLSAAARRKAEMQVRELHLDQLTMRALDFSDAQKDLIYLFANGYRAKNAAEIFEVSEDAIKQRKLQIQRQLGVNSFMVVVNICARAGLTFHPIS